MNTHLSMKEEQDRPKQLQDRIFTRLFEAAEIARFTPKEREAYEESLKYYRDIKNVVDTAEEEGIEKGIQKGAYQKALEIAQTLKQQGFSTPQIQSITGLSASEIDAL